MNKENACEKTLEEYIYEALRRLKSSSDNGVKETGEELEVYFRQLFDHIGYENDEKEAQLRSISALTKERDRYEDAFNRVCNYVLSIPSNGFHFHVRREGDAQKQIKAHFLQQADKENDSE